MNKIKNWVRNAVRLYPEIFALPLAILGLSLLQKCLLWMDSTNAIYQDDRVQTIAMSAIIVLSMNAMSHGAIKWNQTPAFDAYKLWLKEGGDMPTDYFKLLVLYVIAFALVVNAVI